MVVAGTVGKGLFGNTTAHRLATSIEGLKALRNDANDLEVM